MTVDIATAAREAGTARKLTEVELAEGAAVLARAFYDDPAWSWALPDDGRRLAQLRRSFELFLHHLWLPQDVTYTTGTLAGVAAWELPGKWRASVREQLRMFPPMAASYRRHLPRAFRGLMQMEKDHPREPHYYLAMVGVDPDWQGRGIGSAIMRPILDRCDEEKMPAYLEASSPRSRVLYERHGFEVTQEFFLGKGSPPLWRMWRRPLTANS